MAQAYPVGDFRIANHSISPGTRADIEIPVARLPSGTWLSLPITVLHGGEPGPGVWVSSTVHGDELNGIESIRRVLETLAPASLRGTVVAVPVVNVFGLVNQSRYLPDRRDLNRSFPGSAHGSLASRLAHLFMTEVVARCAAGVDLHTGSDRRANLPQVRADLHDWETRRLAEAFGAPIMIHSRVRDGSLREAATELGARVLLYEGGEAMRFDEEAIAVGASGVARTLAALGVGPDAPTPLQPTHESHRSRWARARRGGIARIKSDLGEHVQRGDVLALISGPSGENESQLRSPVDGLVVGLSRNPLVNQGDAIAHIAELGAKGAGSDAE